jgi:hypothetical protein
MSQIVADGIIYNNFISPPGHLLYLRRLRHLWMFFCRDALSEPL